MKEIIIIKNKLDSENPDINKDIQKNARESLEKDTERYYNSTGNDINLLSRFIEQLGEKQFVLIISYIKNGKIYTEEEKVNNGEIENIYIGIGRIINDKKKDKCNIKYKMKKCISDKKVIANLLDNIELDFQNDYIRKSYILLCKQKMLSAALRDILIEHMELPHQQYSDIHKIFELAEYAQHNTQCKRMHGILSEDKNRSEFQRDRERIVNSKAFRRLVDKAQIFSAEKGDHYRTRMTHTLEVNQIAKAIAIALRLNLDLTEAIALAHDLGHTPFGHQGERTLRDILTGKELGNIFNIPDQFIENSSLGGFRHNFQSIRILSKLEEKYVEYQGLDVSYQVLEGVLKHTSMKGAVLKEFIDEESIEELHEKQSFASSLEGQVVAVADEIAQRGHDVDDALTSGLITLNELIDCLSIDKFERLKMLLENERENIDKYCRVYVDENELCVGRIISCITGYLINDVILNSKKNITDYICTHRSEVKKGVFTEKLVDFSQDAGGQAACDFLEKIINKKVISDTEVAIFDYNARIVVRKLFEAYYKNPKLLHKGTLRKIYIDILLHKDKRVSLSAIDLRDGNIDIVNLEIKELNETRVELSPTGELDDNNYVRYEKRKIFIRNIVDYIAGMTDSYAVAEYNRIK